MKATASASLLLAFAMARAISASTHAAEATAVPPRFNAVLTLNDAPRFILMDATGHPSSYLDRGDTFQGYTIKGYDAAAQALDVERNGEKLRLPLVEAVKIKAAPADPATGAGAGVSEAEAKAKKIAELEQRLAKARAASASLRDQATQLAQASEAGDLTGRSEQEIRAELNPFVDQLGMPTTTLIGGELRLEFGTRIIPVGSPIVVTVGGRRRTLGLKSIDATSFTVAYNGHEFTRPVAPARAEELSPRPKYAGQRETL